MGARGGLMTTSRPRRQTSQLREVVGSGEWLTDTVQNFIVADCHYG